jgi:hypothetical protein
MAAPYFQKSPWTPFVHEGITYDLSHLDEYQFAVTDTDDIERHIAVTFSGHCFTRKLEPSDVAELQYDASDRTPAGVFCFERYGHSLGLRQHIASAVTSKVWNAASDRDVYAIVPVVDHSGRLVLYAIVFNLIPVQSLPVSLHMRIETAYPCDRKPIDTFGEVRFRHLVALRMRRQSPGRLTNRDRKRPHLP